MPKARAVPTGAMAIATLPSTALRVSATGDVEHARDMIRIDHSRTADAEAVAGCLTVALRAAVRNMT